MFLDESLREGDLATHRYSLRLGNPRYPFMKLVLQEHLVEGEYFFEVDTHDQMFELDGDEADKFARLKRYNLEVKQLVEEAWSRRDLPTAAHIKGLIETRPLPRAQPNGLRILVVDDDADIAATLAHAARSPGLRGRGAGRRARGRRAGRRRPP